MTNDAKFFRIKGGVKLQGEIKIAGAKNALTKQLVASLLTTEPCVFTNVPRITEIDKVLEMLSGIGSQYEWLNGQTLRIQTPKILNARVDQKFQKYNRIPILLLGPLLHRTGEATVPIPGGCKIGSRPVDLHITALESMGANISTTGLNYKAHSNSLAGTDIILTYPSVGTTENIILSAALARGTTTIHNAAIEPEIFDTILFLNKMGAKIEKFPEKRCIVIKGVKFLRGTTHHTIPDRIEAASFATLALVTNGQIKIKNAVEKHLTAFLNVFIGVGGAYVVKNDGIVFLRKTPKLAAVGIETDVHPGFMTDWQQPFAVILTQADGISVIHETVYEKRFDYVKTLNDMGAEIELVGYCLGQPCRFQKRSYLHSCIIKGPTKLHAKIIKIPDLRAGFAHVIAALIAEGTSDIYGIDQLERGYANVARKLESIGAQIEVIDS